MTCPALTPTEPLVESGAVNVALPVMSPPSNAPDAATDESRPSLLSQISRFPLLSEPAYIEYVLAAEQ